MTTTTATKKPTKKQTFNEILSSYNLTDEHKKFLLHEIELLEKKNSSDKGLTAIQKANLDLKEAILGFMEKDTLYTVSTLIKSVPELNELSNQKVTALMRGLIDEGKVEKRPDKKVTYFCLVESDD